MVAFFVFVCCIMAVVFALAMLNFWAIWGPVPLWSGAKYKARSKATEVLHISQKKIRDYKFDFHGIFSQRRYRNLVAYTRYIHQCSTDEIDALITLIQVERTKLHTLLSPYKLTSEQVEVFKALRGIHRSMAAGSVDEGYKKRKAIEHTMVYAMAHLDQADSIISIVKSREVYEIKQVKQLMSEISAAPVTPLAVGVL